MEASQILLFFALFFPWKFWCSSHCSAPQPSPRHSHMGRFGWLRHIQACASALQSAAAALVNVPGLVWGWAAHAPQLHQNFQGKTAQNNNICDTSKRSGSDHKPAFPTLPMYIILAYCRIRINNNYLTLQDLTVFSWRRFTVMNEKSSTRFWELAFPIPILSAQWDIYEGSTTPPVKMNGQAAVMPGDTYKV